MIPFLCGAPFGAGTHDSPNRADMTDANARTVANIVLAGAALGAAIVIIRTPPLRRVAWGLARTAATTLVPVWLTREVRDAWAASGARTAPAAPGSRGI